MKVEQHRPEFTTQSVRGPADPSAGLSGPAKASPAAPDSLELSPDLRLAQAAVTGVGDPASVRPDAVSRAKALMDRGELGSDLGRLADKIIDSLIDS